MYAGLVAEFVTPEAMIAAARALREKGYRRLDTFSPYPVHGAERALGLRRSRLGWILFPIGFAGAGLGYLVQLYCNGYDYPLDVGGRPLNSAPAYIPITFESGVLATSLAGFLVFLILTRLPELWAPVFDVEGFERASIDRFWVGVDVRDPMYNPVQLERDFAELGAIRVARAKRRER